jgi:hypothetical protein
LNKIQKASVLLWRKRNAPKKYKRTFSSPRVNIVSEKLCEFVGRKGNNSESKRINKPTFRQLSKRLTGLKYKESEGLKEGQVKLSSRKN